MTENRTLIISNPTDFFVGKILAAIACDRYEQLPIDVLRFGPKPADEIKGMAMHEAVPMPAWPNGVREFSIETLGDRVTPIDQSLEAFVAGYARVGVLSLNPWNVDIVRHLIDNFPQLPLSVICMDDEIDRHFLYQRAVAADPSREAESRLALHYSTEVQETFEKVSRFFINPRPWEMMLRTGRKNDLTLIPWLPPLINHIEDMGEVRRSNHCYNVVLFVKPAVLMPQFQDIARMIAAGNRDRPVQIVTFRNDLPTQSEIDGVPVRCYPYPIDEIAYHRIIAACHGVVINPRGGMATIRDAVRYKLDVITPMLNMINHIVLAADVGLEFTDIGDLRLDDPDGAIARRRAKNSSALGRYEFDAIAAFRREYCPG